MTNAPLQSLNKFMTAPKKTILAMMEIPSEWESFCVPVAESMYFGVPPVVHHIPPLPEVAGSGGLVIDKKRPQVAATKMLALLENETAYTAMSPTAVVQAQQFTDNSLAEAIMGMMRDMALPGKEVVA